jgi:hypothetical protein
MKATHRQDARGQMHDVAALRQLDGRHCVPLRRLNNTAGRLGVRKRESPQGGRSCAPGP